jgi:hypothetical protein
LHSYYALNSRIIVSALLLAVSALAFATLAYVPVAIVETTTEFGRSSYRPSTETLTTNYYCFTVYLTLSQSLPYVPFVTNYTFTPIPQTITSSLQSPTTYTATQTLTIHIPASQALGLSPRAFMALAIIVVGILALITVWITLKSRTRRKSR